MKKAVFLFIFVVLYSIGFCQSSQVRYYNSSSLKKEVIEKQAKYSESIFKNSDSSITVEVKNITKGEIVFSQTYLGQEPWGIWKMKIGGKIEELNYAFQLKYNGDECLDTIEGVPDCLQNFDSLKYVAPVLEGGLSLYQFISKNIVYPAIATEQGISGKVYVAFKITDLGLIENIFVVCRANVLLEKEAVRIVRLLKFNNPPILDGKAQNLCVVLPINFRID